MDSTLPWGTRERTEEHMFNCLTYVAPATGLAVKYSSCFISVMNLDLYVHCFESLMSSSPSRGPNNLYVYMNFSRTQGETERS